MKKLKYRFKQKLRDLILWAISTDVLALQKEYADTNLRLLELRNLVERLQPITAIDFGYREAGFIVVAQHMNGNDLVKIIPIEPKRTAREYREIVNRLEQEYGARPPSYADACPGDREVRRELLKF